MPLFSSLNHLFLHVQNMDSDHEVMMHMRMEEEANVVADE
jgi:Zn-dependent peptidase ImmA (M78 family)